MTDVLCLSASRWQCSAIVWPAVVELWCCGDARSSTAVVLPPQPVNLPPVLCTWTHLSLANMADGTTPALQPQCAWWVLSPIVALLRLYCNGTGHFLSLKHLNRSSPAATVMSRCPHSVSPIGGHPLAMYADFLPSSLLSLTLCVDLQPEDLQVVSQRAPHLQHLHLEPWSSSSNLVRLLPQLFPNLRTLRIRWVTSNRWSVMISNQ